MPLDPDKIKYLQAIKNRPRKTTGRGKKAVDTNVRDMETWFKLDRRMMNNETKELFRCENPNCVDPRQSGIMVSEVNGVFMCRYCFIDGWLASNPDQTTLEASG